MKKTDNGEVNPGKIFDTCFAFATSRILLSGVELEIFTHIANGHRTMLDIARAAQADSRGIEALLNSLVAMNFLTKSNNLYDLTPPAKKFLVKGLPTYYGDFVLHIDLLWESWKNLTKVISTGKSYLSVDKEEGEKFFKKLVPLLFPMNYPAAKAAAEALGVGNTWKNLNVLDIGSGSGAWGIAFAEQDAGARITAQDWPDILKITKEFTDKFNLNGRFTYLPGDLREVDFGQNKYDLVILGHVCHSEGAEKSRTLLSRSYRSLKQGGKLLIAEMIPDDTRSAEVFPLLFAVNMLVHTTEGNTFTMAEYREWLLSAGFHSITTLHAPSPSPLILASK